MAAETFLKYENDTPLWNIILPIVCIESATGPECGDSRNILSLKLPKPRLFSIPSVYPFHKLYV